MLSGSGRPSKRLVSNFLRVVGIDDTTRSDWEGAWDRVAFSTYATSRELPTSSEAELDPDAEHAVSEDLIYDVAADVIDIVKAVAVQVVSDAIADLNEVVQKTRSAFAEIDKLRDSARESTSRAKHDAAEIVKRANSEAVEIVKNAKARSSYSVTTSSLLRDSVSGSISSDSLVSGASTLPSVKYSLGSFIVPGTEPASTPAPAPAPIVAAGLKEVPTKPEKKQSAAKVEQPLLKLNVGDRVNHDEYGLGTVVKQDGKGPRLTVTIDFEDKGPVRLMLIGGVPMRRVDGLQPGDDEPPF